MSYWYAWIYGSPHTNPDDQIIGGTHLHIYKEGFDDRWAYPIDLNCSKISKMLELHLRISVAFVI